MDEFELIRRYFDRQQASDDGVIVGIGDDGAVLAPERRSRHQIQVIDTLVSKVCIFQQIRIPLILPIAPSPSIYLMLPPWAAARAG